MVATQNIVKPVERVSLINPKINMKPVNKDSIEAMTIETDKKVSGTFVNIECPGQPAKISGKYYRGMEYFCKTFHDNEKCTIPLSVARFINERCCHDQHGYLLDEKGQSIKSSKPVPRYKFMADF